VNASWTLRNIFTAFLAIGAIVAMLFIAALVQVWRTQHAVAEAHDLRYQSYLLADELRQSSDDLTRLARTYVVSGDARYEQQYNDILDIRNGKKPRPENYERIYWDFVAAGNARPRPDGETVSLADLMKRAGFSDEEFGKLKEAQDNSDALVRTEVVAMNAVKGLFDDGTGKFVKKDAPDMEMARKLVHSEDYHRYKAQIMKPLDEFFALLEKRTGSAVDAAEAASRTAFMLAAMLLGLSLCTVAGALLFLYRRLDRQLGAEPSDAQEIANRIAAGDLAVHIAVRPGDDGSLMHAMRSMRDSLANIVAQVRAGTDTIATASTQLSAGNRELSSRTESQAGALEETASSMEELTSTVKQNADNARQANSLADSASEVASKGGAVVSEVVQTMGSINESSKKIVDIIAVIDGIAFQTNILALNAAVEAARAGEQGRGFAVVAAEVRNLAQRSANAAKEIKALIGDSVEKVDSGSRLVNQAGATMMEIVDSVKRVSDIIAEITAASSEQTSGIEQINSAIAQMDESTQQNASLVEEAAAASEELQHQATRLAELVSVFRLDGSQAAAAQAQSPRPAPKPAASAAVVPMRSRPARPRKHAIVNEAAALPSSTRRVRAAAAGGGDWEEF